VVREDARVVMPGDEPQKSARRGARANDDGAAAAAEQRRASTVDERAPQARVRGRYHHAAVVVADAGALLVAGALWVADDADGIPRPFTTPGIAQPLDVMRPRGSAVARHS